jgi:hypothetical protein
MPIDSDYTRKEEYVQIKVILDGKEKILWAIKMTPIVFQGKMMNRYQKVDKEGHVKEKMVKGINEIEHDILIGEPIWEKRAGLSNKYGWLVVIE